MKQNQNKKILCLAAAALVLSAGVSAERAMAYFTDQVSASGSASVRLSLPDTELEEEVKEGIKYVKVKNTGDCDCYVRVQAYAGEGRIKDWNPGEGWEKGRSDEYYYYSVPLSSGDVTSSLDIVVSLPEGEDPDTFNVIVVSEHTPVLYDADGVPDRVLSWADREGE